MDSAGKRAKSQKPAHGPPLQARVVAANRTVVTTNLRRSWRTWTEQVGAKQTERGQTMRAVGMAWQRRAGTQSPQDTAAAGKHSRQTMRPAQALKQNNSQQMAGLAANNSRRCWPASRRAVQVDGGSTVVLATQEAGSDLPTCLPPTYRLCLSLYIPTPLICKTQFSPNLFFFVVFIFILLSHSKFVP